MSANAKRESSAVPVDIAFITVNYNTLDCISQLAESPKTGRPVYVYFYRGG